MAKVKVDEYIELGEVQIAKRLLGIAMKREVDPTQFLIEEAKLFISEQKKNFNSIVENSFDLGDDFIKFEFHYFPEYADRIDKDDCSHRMKCFITNVYLKEKSLIFFQTEYRFDVKPGCWNHGTIRVFGGKKYELEEVYFNKISSVKVSTEEEVHEIIGSGCFPKIEPIKSSKETLLIRAGENYNIYAEEDQSKELKDARRIINDKVALVN